MHSQISSRVVNLVEPSSELAPKFLLGPIYTEKPNLHSKNSSKYKVTEQPSLLAGFDIDNFAKVLKISDHVRRFLKLKPTSKP